MINNPIFKSSSVNPICSKSFVNDQTEIINELINNQILKTLNNNTHILKRILIHQIFDISIVHYPTITYYWTVPLILDHSYLVGKLTNSKIAETKALEPLKS